MVILKNCQKIEKLAKCLIISLYYHQKAGDSKDAKDPKKTIEGCISKQTACAIMCLQTAECKSFNYCNQKLCELNTNDFYSLGVETSMVEDYKCDYIGMDIEERPHCEIHSDSADIQEMSHIKNPNIFLSFLSFHATKLT